MFLFNLIFLLFSFFQTNRQIIKAVNECKVQAANAKKLVGNIKHKKNNDEQLNGMIKIIKIKIRITKMNLSKIKRKDIFSLKNKFRHKNTFSKRKLNIKVFLETKFQFQFYF